MSLDFSGVSRFLCHRGYFAAKKKVKELSAMMEYHSDLLHGFASDRMDAKERYLANIWLLGENRIANSRNVSKSTSNQMVK